MSAGTNTSTMATIHYFHDAHDYPISYGQLAIRTIIDIDSLLTAAIITPHMWSSTRN